MEHYLDKLFNPNTVAVIGASNRIQAVGTKVFSNLLLGGFAGKIYPVNPKYKAVQNTPCYSSILDINDVIDLVVIVTPPRIVPQIMIECGQKNVRHAIILSAGFSEEKTEGGELEQKILEIAQQFQMHIIGPNCLGVMRPSIGLNATFENSPVLAGNIAFVSQSGALCAAILDWAINEKIGFSTLVSLGNSADLDFGDILDYLAMDPKTNCILLYVEGIRHARRFMSGLRAAAYLKPVVAIKGGRNSQGTQAAISHTGAMIGANDVFDAALHRAGVVRVETIKQLFSAAEVFASELYAHGNRLMIVTNGGGGGVMAADHAADLMIPLAEITTDLESELNQLLPKNWSHLNPIDILGDATPERYAKVIEACIASDNYDGLLAILVPVAMSQPLKVAEQLVELKKKTKKPLIACWMGREQVKSSWRLFAKNRIPYFSTPETAVEAFSYLANYYHNQQLLLQVPEPISFQSHADLAGAQLILDSVIAQQRKILTTIESKAILKSFGIPITQTIAVKTAAEALVAAESLGFPVVMKIHSPDITHKQDVGGVQLNITNAAAVVSFFKQLTEKAKRQCPEARILGVTLEKMYKTTNDRELMVGVLQDPVFGPTINFGAGGSLVEIMQDRVVALPPLNLYLIRNLISQSKVAKLLGKFRNKPAVNIAAIENLLLAISEMACELPQIQEMDINPLIINEKEVIAVDARIVINAEKNAISYSHMAIHPYPHRLITHQQLMDGKEILIRPIRPEDAKLEQGFVRQLSARTKHFRYMVTLREMTPEMLKRTTQIDYDREMSLVALTQDDNNHEVMIGSAQYVTNPDFLSCEFAVVIADEWQNKGIAHHLMVCLIEAAKAKNLKLMKGMVLATNRGMLTLAKNLGFSIKSVKDDPSVLEVVKQLF